VKKKEQKKLLVRNVENFFNINNRQISDEKMKRVYIESGRECADHEKIMHSGEEIYESET
jgi:hypothetical protein